MLLGAAVLTISMISGCGSRYEAIAIESGQAQMGAAAQQQVPDSSQPVEAQISSNETILSMEPAVSMAERDDTIYVTGNQVNIRAAASTSSQVVAVVNQGEELKRTGVGDVWSRIQYQGQVCYISNSYVSATEPKTAAADSDRTGTEAAAGSGQTGTEAAAGSQSDSPTSTASGEIKLDSSWKYAEFSKINTGTAYLYRSDAASRRGITVCVNAGHGTSGGSSVKTLCHPDGTAKVTSGTTSAGATQAVAVSGGMTFSDGTPEAKVTLAMAKILKDKLLKAGYDVLMIRESDDVQLDNIARTVIANNKANCHIALHWDSTASDKGAFYMSVPDAASYRNMEPVKSNWEKHNALGESLIAGLKAQGVKIFSGGSMEMDLTQTSYSTVPSVDIELGDKASDHSSAALDLLAEGILSGVNRYFGQ